MIDDNVPGRRTPSLPSSGFHTGSVPPATSCQDLPPQLPEEVVIPPAKRSPPSLSLTSTTPESAFP